jgi:pantoate--beta-alanine ligase
MRIVTQPRVLTTLLQENKMKGKSIGFIPTMGALHEGHASLIRVAHKAHDIVVVSIFVNPAQFGPSEDFRKYPRRKALDVALCEKLGVDYIFYPSTHGMYPRGFSTYVTVEGMDSVLCGASRPGHFKGMATVVAKLFYIVMPDTAYFGQKDAQQAAIIRKMVEDLNMPVEISILPTVRDGDGLALSSRNAYLSAAERSDALVLSQSLREARLLIQRGQRSVSRITAAMRKMITARKRVRIDYVSIVDAGSLRSLALLKGRCLIALAAWVGKTRLIDNIEVKVGEKNKVK